MVQPEAGSAVRARAKGPSLKPVSSLSLITPESETLRPKTGAATTRATPHVSKRHTQIRQQHVHTTAKVSGTKGRGKNLVALWSRRQEFPLRNAGFRTLNSGTNCLSLA